VEAIAALRTAIASGEPWPDALLRAMGAWTLAEEVLRGRHHRYLILDEAFDWLLLARRLAGEVDGLIPKGDRRQRLATGRFLREFSDEEVRRVLGTSKYRAYLNYWYGVTVEGALQLAVREETRKERISRGLSPETRIAEEVYRRVYGAPRSELLSRFQAEHGEGGASESRGARTRMFTYWLFRLRLQRSDPVRVASDTRKALELLYRTGEGDPPGSPVGPPVRARTLVRGAAGR
jgi:hypothetical protein